MCFIYYKKGKSYKAYYSEIFTLVSICLSRTSLYKGLCLSDQESYLLFQPAVKFGYSGAFVANRREAAE